MSINGEILLPGVVGFLSPVSGLDSVGGFTHATFIGHVLSLYSGHYDPTRPPPYLGEALMGDLHITGVDQLGIAIGSGSGGTGFGAFQANILEPGVPRSVLARRNEHKPRLNFSTCTARSNIGAELRSLSMVTAPA